jgi:hypothetical protein
MGAGAGTFHTSPSWCASCIITLALLGVVRVPLCFTASSNSSQPGVHHRCRALSP